MKTLFCQVIIMATSSICCLASDETGSELTTDIFGGVVTKVTDIDKWSRGTVKAIGEHELVSAEGSFKPGALVGRVINPNFERSLGVIDEDMKKKYGDAPQYCVKYYKIVANTENTIRTDPADGSLTEYAQPGDRYLLCGFFTCKKIGDRYMMFTPLGHPFFGLGSDACYLNYAGYLKDPAVYEAKYQSSRARWYTSTVNRMKSAVGFNMSAGYFSDVPPWSPARRDVFLKPELPFVIWTHPLEVGMKGKSKGGFFDSPIKDVFVGVHRRNCGDIFDPRFPQACEMMAERLSKKLKNNPWFIGYVIEETDFLFGFARDRKTFHLGWAVMAASPVQEKTDRGEYFTEKDEKGMPTIRYTDTKVYTKYAMRDFLKAKYETIEKLNAAWGSTYSTWDSTPEGHGKGTGLLDENGKLGAAWLGKAQTAEGAKPEVYEDLSNFLYHYIDTLHALETAAIRKLDTNHFLIGCKVPSDQKEYQAMAKHVDMTRGLAPKGTPTEYVRPGIVAMYLSAEEDSSMHVHLEGPKPPHRTMTGVAKTQPEKAKLYQEKLFKAFDYTPDEKTFPVVMMSYWSWGEDEREKRNWGFVSLKDNLYDGKEATKLGADGIAGTPDDEDRDYGDCVTGVRNANQALMQKLKDIVSKGRNEKGSDAKQDDFLVPEDQY